MAGNIKGITIEFRGETTELEQAIKKINSEVRSTDNELKKVDRALKFNPQSVELWRQKQTLLTQKIQQTKEKLDVLRDAQKKMDADGVEKNSQEYRELQREIITTESKLKNFETQLRKVGNVKLKVLSQQLKSIGDKMTAVGKKMTTAVTAPIVAGYTLASNYASDYEENLNKLDVAFGKNSESVKEWANSARSAYGLSKVQATASASAFGALGKGIGLSESKAAEMSMTLAGLSADLGSYFNVGVDESSKALEGIFTGESEALKRFGVVMTDTNLKQFAADQNLVWNEMTQGEKTMLRYQYVLEKTKDAQGDFSRTSDGTANSTKIFQASLQDLGTTIGTVLLPIITPIIQKVTEWINKFNELSPATQKIITIVGLVVAVLGPVLVVVGTLISAIGSIIGLIGVAGPVIAGLAGPITLAIGVIAMLIAIGVSLYKNWDKIKAKAVEFKNKVVSVWNEFKAKTTSAFNSIKEAIIKPIQTAIDKVKAIIEKIKGFFPISIGKIMGNLKLPHFKLTGKFSLKDMTVPHLSVDWYAKGGIFNSPNVIGVGEAGSEAVVPLDKFWKKLDNLQGGDNININIYATDSQSAKDIANEVEKILIKKAKGQRLAWQ